MELSPLDHGENVVFTESCHIVDSPCGRVMAEGGEYSVHVLPPAAALARLEEISRLLCHGRPEFAALFGWDHRLRLEAQAGLSTAVAARAGELAAHACIISDGEGPGEVGLVAHVFTHPDHRQRGLASRLCRELIAAWDAARPAGSVLLLGTGSPHAAR
jgi:GNAT superfamily N-acetyltransferase